MKRYVLLLLMLCCFKAASSQVLIALLFGDKLNSGSLEFGLMVGPTFTNISGIKSDFRTGVDFGLYFNVKVSDRIYFHPEAIPKLVFGAKGISPYLTGDAVIDSLYTNGSVNRTVKAIGLPLLVRYRIAGLFFVEAGPQIDLLTQSKDVFKTDVDDNKLSYEIKTKDNYTKFDVGYALGLAYKIKPGNHSMTIGARYYGGLTDIMKNENGKQLNNAFFLNVYIPVGAGKATEKTSANGK